jgi:hypothetical protein
MTDENAVSDSSFIILTGDLCLQRFQKSFQIANDYPKFTFRCQLPASIVHFHALSHTFTTQLSTPKRLANRHFPRGQLNTPRSPLSLHTHMPSLSAAPHPPQCTQHASPHQLPLPPTHPTTRSFHLNTTMTHKIWAGAQAQCHPRSGCTGEK